jgi:outer membrane lipoprotein-sorting protein
MTKLIAVCLLAVACISGCSQSNNSRSEPSFQHANNQQAKDFDYELMQLQHELNMSLLNQSKEHGRSLGFPTID